MTLVQFTVLGDTPTKGNMRRNAAGGMYDSNKNLAGWTARAQLEARSAMRGQRIMDGPVRLTLRFVVARPGGHFTSKRELSAEGRRHPYPDTRAAGDLDKLERAVGDALTDIVWRDDARIVQKESTKVYGTQARVEVLVEDAAPSRPSDDPPGRLRRLSGAIGETADDVDRSEHLASVIHKLDGFGSCRCGRIVDPLTRFCPGCGRPTFSPYPEVTG